MTTGYKAMPDSHMGYRWRKVRYGMGPDRHLAYVLGVRSDSQHTKYVVWVYNLECGGFAHGHYTESPSSALENFVKRTAPDRFCSQEGLNSRY